MLTDLIKIVLLKLFCYVLQSIRPAMQAASEAEGKGGEDFSPLAMFAFFVNRVKENLHIIIAFSPIGDAFRNRLRQFPSLINCCTIDWFQVSVILENKFHFSTFCTLMHSWLGEFI